MEDLRNPKKCPSCKVGNLTPSGKRLQKDEGKEPYRKQEEQTEYVCDNCNITHHVIGLNEYVDVSDRTDVR